MTSWQVVRLLAGTFILLSLALGIPSSPGLIQPRCPSFPRKDGVLRLGGTLVLARNAPTDQIAQRVDRFIGNAVVHAGATALTAYQALLGHQGQMPGDVGCRVAAELGQFTDIAFALTQKVEDAQARGLCQRLEVCGDLLQGFWWEVFHRNIPSAGAERHPQTSLSQGCHDTSFD